jgi:hypothetical protein
MYRYSVSITTNSVSLIPVCGQLNTTLYDKVCLALFRWYMCSPSTLMSYSNQTDHHNVAYIYIYVENGIIEL